MCISFSLIIFWQKKAPSLKGRQSCFTFRHCFSAKAYQSIIMLMGKQQLFSFWQTRAKVNHLEWTEDAASQVLEAWKRNFTKVGIHVLNMVISWSPCVTP